MIPQRTTLGPILLVQLFNSWGHVVNGQAPIIKHLVETGLLFDVAVGKKQLRIFQLIRCHSSNFQHPLVGQSTDVQQSLVADGLVTPWNG
jgi:hypothetical protein